MIGLVEESSKNTEIAGRPDRRDESNRSTKETPVLRVDSVVKNRFILDAIIGRGGMGVIYRARDIRKVEAQDRQPFVALKVLGEDFKNNPDSFIALQREARKSQELAHPNIVTVYDFDKDGPHVYMTMEYLTGKPLNAVLRQPDFKNKTLDERWSIIEQMGRALVYAHAKNIIHSDFKPGNIFVCDDGVVKVLDFGIARAAQTTEHDKGDTTVFDAGKLGALTPPYASCEMLENVSADFRDDIYALACVSYEILTGIHPFTRLSATQARDSKQKPTRIKNISKRRWNAIVHGLSFSRSGRTASVTQFLEELELLQPRTTSNSRFYWLWTLLVVAAIAANGVYLYFRSPAEPTEDLVAEPELPPQNPNLSQEDLEKIDRLMEIAELHFTVERLTEPIGSNALFSYKEILDIDPSYGPAREGLNKIAEHFQSQARISIDRGDLSEAKRLLTEGFKANPNHPGLLALRRLIN